MPEQPVDPYAPPEVPKEKTGGIVRVGIMGVLLVGAGIAYAVNAGNSEPIGSNAPQILAEETEPGEFVAHQYADAGTVATDATPGAVEPAATPAPAPQPAPAQRRAPRPEPTRAVEPAPTPAPVTTPVPAPTPAPVAPAPLTPDPLAPAPSTQPVPPPEAPSTQPPTTF